MAWMLAKIHREKCIYQNDEVDHLEKAKHEDLLTENADDNRATDKPVLTAFRKLTPDTMD